MRLLDYGSLEIVSGKLYGLGGIVRNDNRISWVPRDATGWLPINSYLLLGDDSAMLIDTGPACHRQQLLLQLRSLISSALPLSIFLTRAEADCIGNLDAVVRRFNVVGVFTGGVQNPFDFIDDALEHIVENAYDEDTIEALTGRHLQRTENGEAIALDGGRRVYVYAAPLRILTTFWLYDDTTGTLFTSDLFGHNMMTGDPAVRWLEGLTDDSAIDASVDGARRHIYTKFGWMKIADKTILAAKLTGFLAGLDVQALAPSHGRVVVGRDVVSQEFDIVGRALWGAAIGHPLESKVG